MNMTMVRPLGLPEKWPPAKFMSRKHEGYGDNVMATEPIDDRNLSHEIVSMYCRHFFHRKFRSFDDL